MFFSVLCLQKAQSPILFNASTFDRFAFRKRKSESPETISNRTIPLHQNDSAPSERFHFIRTILLHQNDSFAEERSCYRNLMRLTILRQTFLILIPRKPSLVLKLYRWRGRKFWWSCDNPWEIGKASSCRTWGICSQKQDN